MPNRLIQKSESKKRKRKSFFIISIFIFALALITIFINDYNKNRITPNIEPISIEEMKRIPFRRGVKCLLFYGTDRESKESNEELQEYGDKTSKKISFGKASIFVPPSKRVGQTKPSLIKKIIQGDLSYGNLEVDTIEPLKEELFWKLLTKILAPLKEEEKKIIVFISSQNIPFEQLAIISASSRMDRNYMGIGVFFSASNSKSLKQQNKFINELSKRFNAENISIIRF